MNDIMKDSTSSNLDEFRKLPDFPAFEAFAKALWRNEAAVMVGAGFSRVCRREPGSPTPPLWFEFARVMEADLGYSEGTGPDALRLAQEYHTLHGEDGLTRLIRRLVADDEWEPSELHKRLLEFPWRDILTTNWDTLLERTKPETPDRIYSCVRTVHEIAHQRSPRIVKLHGSLPSYKPFVFTEDDFRTYPMQFAPFVNLAQQVMLENELCLVGFSGVDPNFLAWSGWVRDTLNVSARRIRLVGVLRLSPVTRSLLESRNVTPIDLYPLVERLHVSEQHEKALEYFFDALQDLRPPSPFAWNISTENFGVSHDAPEDQKPTREQIAKAWAIEREAYPGWICCPQSERLRLRNAWPILRKARESDQVELHFATERIWRDRIGGGWLHSQDLTNADQFYDSASHCLSPSTCIELCASAAAECRRFQQWDSWDRWISRLALITASEAKLHLAYEKGLRALLDWDDDGVLNAANALKSDKPIWIMRRAGLLSTLFLYKEAAEGYQHALRSVREKLLVAPNSAWLISLEGWASMFHRVSYSVLNEDSYLSFFQDSDETRKRYLGAKSDPWDFITQLERQAREQIDRNREDSELWKLSFKSGTYSPDRTVRMGGGDICPFYGLLEIIERTGAPISFKYTNVFASRLATAYTAFNEPDEKDLLAFLSRYQGGDTKTLDWFLSRMQVALLSDEVVTQLITVIRRRIDRLVGSSAIRDNTDSYVGFLLALLSRVVIRSSSDKAAEIFNWAVSLFNSSALSWSSFKDCSAVLESAIEPMGAIELKSALDRALSLHFPSETNGYAREHDWPDFVQVFSTVDLEDFSIPVTSHARVDTLINAVRSGEKSDRTNALKRLYLLYRNNALIDSQQQALEAALWNNCTPTGWPAETDLMPWVFLDLPGKARAAPLFQQHIVNAVANGNVDGEVLRNLRNGLEYLSVNVPMKTLISCIKACLDWKPREVDPRGLMDTTQQTDDFISQEIGLALSQSLLPRVALADIPRDVRYKLMKTNELKLISSSAAVAFQIYRLWPERLTDSMELIRSAMASRDPNRVYPAYSGIRQFVKNAVSSGIDVPRDITETLLHVAEQRTQPGLSSALDVLSHMVEENLLSREDLKRLVQALPDVIEEYNYNQRRLEVPAKAELPLVRKGVHRLVDILKDQFSALSPIKTELARDPLPEVRSLSML